MINVHVKSYASSLIMFVCCYISKLVWSCSAPQMSGGQIKADWGVMLTLGVASHWSLIVVQCDLLQPILKEFPKMTKILYGSRECSMWSLHWDCYMWYFTTVENVFA